MNLRKTNSNRVQARNYDPLLKRDFTLILSIKDSRIYAEIMRIFFTCATVSEVLRQSAPVAADEASQLQAAAETLAAAEYQ